jgi:hypothetical protein
MYAEPLETEVETAQLAELEPTVLRGESAASFLGWLDQPASPSPDMKHLLEADVYPTR